MSLNSRPYVAVSQSLSRQAPRHAGRTEMDIGDTGRAGNGKTLLGRRGWLECWPNFGRSPRLWRPAGERHKLPCVSRLLLQLSASSGDRHRRHEGRHHREVRRHRRDIRAGRVRSPPSWGALPTWPWASCASLAWKWLNCVCAPRRATVHGIRDEDHSDCRRGHKSREGRGTRAQLQ